MYSPKIFLRKLHQPDFFLIIVNIILVGIGVDPSARLPSRSMRSLAA
jgi:hypothetical protein